MNEFDVLAIAQQIVFEVTYGINSGILVICNFLRFALINNNRNL